MAGAALSLKPFLSVRQLAASLNRNYRTQMMYIAYGLRPEQKHRNFTIPKKNGGQRTICAPRAALLSLQKDLKRLVEADYTPRSHVHGFVSGRQRSIVSNAQLHTGKKWVLNVDLQDYFETIHFGRILGRLRARPYEYSEKVARFVAHVACYEKEIVVDGVSQSTSVLMPGGALSPLLANIVTDRLDSELSRMCNQLGCNYTRYADDISISSSRARFPPQIARFEDPETREGVILSERFQEIVETNGFQINHSKTRLQGFSIRQEVTGLVVNRKINVKRNFVRQVRSMLHDWSSNGIERTTANHFENHRPNRGRLAEYEASNFEWVVRGKIEFIRQVRGPADPIARTLASRFNDLAEESQFSIPIVETSEILNEAVWFLSNDNDGGYFGTCFAIQENLFATCAHCLGDNLLIFPRQYQDHGLPVEVVSRDDRNDVALIRVLDPQGGFAPRALLQIANDVAINNLSTRDVVQIAGFPQNFTTETVTENTAQVSGFSRVVLEENSIPDENVIGLSGGTFAGMSGGPVLNNGVVVGVVVRGPDEHDRTNPSFAVKATFLLALVEALQQ